MLLMEWILMREVLGVPLTRLKFHDMQEMIGNAWSRSLDPDLFLPPLSARLRRD
jgi:hypothetical protein